jgi:hypothetical protein
LPRRARYTSRPKRRLSDKTTGGWYPIDFARGRPTNPARIPVSPSGRWYYTRRPQLIFPDHVHEFDAGERHCGGPEGLEPQHGSHQPLDRSMILFDDVVEVFGPGGSQCPSHVRHCDFRSPLRWQQFSFCQMAGFCGLRGGEARSLMVAGRVH